MNSNNVGLSVLLPLGCTMLMLNATAAPFPHRGEATPQKAKNAKAAPAVRALKAEDVIATVEGQPITRRELTYCWLQTDTAVPPRLLGSLLTSRWKATKGASLSYSVSESEIYHKLYSEDNLASVGNILSALISNRLVNIEATKRGILVTKTQMMERAHTMFDEFRQRQGLQKTDEELIVQLKLPRDIFMDDMRYRIQTEKLLEADFARRNGHPIGPQDWVVVRELFAGASMTDADKPTEAQFTEARHTVESWLKEVQGGRSMEDVAREHNTNFTRGSGGLRGAVLRGTGTKSLEDAIFALKPGEMSTPQRGKSGWYIFRVEKPGSQISQDEKNASWRQIVEEKKNTFITELRQKAKITSTIPLPNVEEQPNVLNQQAYNDGPMALPPPPPPIRVRNR